MLTWSSNISTKLGTFGITSNGRAITSITFSPVKKPRADALTKKCAKEITAYINGTLKTFTVPIGAEGTSFQQLVWKAMKRIPYGKSRSYSHIADAIGNPKAMRAVGSACRKNPLPIIIPCHRVTAKESLGGYAGGLKLKKGLLKIEATNN